MMSVQTKADDLIDSAKTGVADAISALTEIVIDQCWGYDEYEKEYLQDLKKSLYALVEIRDSLAGKNNE